MAVKAFPKDAPGAALDTKIVNLTAAVAAISASVSPAAKARLDAELAGAQLEAVMHYIEHGRITAAAILSTLS